MTAAAAERIEQAVARLRDLEDGARAWMSVVALGHDAVPALEDLLRSRSESVSQPRRMAAEALGAIGGTEARAALRRALQDALQRQLDPVLRLAEDEVIGAIAAALARVAGPDAAVELVMGLERRPNAECARQLGELRVVAAVPALLRCLSDATAQGAAADALIQIGPPAIPGLTAVALVPISRGSYEGATSVRTRAWAVKLIGVIGGPGSALPLAVALTDVQRDVRLSAALALATRCGGAGLAVPVLVEALADERWLVAQEAEAALSAMAGRAISHSSDAFL